MRGRGILGGRGAATGIVLSMVSGGSCGGGCAAAAAAATATAANTSAATASGAAAGSAIALRPKVRPARAVSSPARHVGNGPQTLGAGQDGWTGLACGEGHASGLCEQTGRPEDHGIMRGYAMAMQ